MPFTETDTNRQRVGESDASRKGHLARVRPTEGAESLVGMRTSASGLHSQPRPLLAPPQPFACAAGKLGMRAWAALSRLPPEVLAKPAPRVRRTKSWRLKRLPDCGFGCR